MESASFSFTGVETMKLDQPGFPIVDHRKYHKEKTKSEKTHIIEIYQSHITGP